MDENGVEYEEDSEGSDLPSLCDEDVDEGQIEELEKLSGYSS